MESEQSDFLLVKDVLSHQKAAFERLVRKYESLVFHIVIPLIKNENDRQDISQDVFLKVYEKLHTFQFKSKLSTWIGNIAYNTSINFLKRKKNISLEDLLNESNAETVVIEENTPNPEGLLIKKQNQQLLTEAIKKLPSIQESILLLFHQEELSLEEISTIVEMPINTVKSHLFRARVKLKELLTHHIAING